MDCQIYDIMDIFRSAYGQIQRPDCGAFSSLQGNGVAMNVESFVNKLQVIAGRRSQLEPIRANQEAQYQAGLAFSELYRQHHAVGGLPSPGPRSVAGLLINECIFGASPSGPVLEVIGKLKRRFYAATDARVASNREHRMSRGWRPTLLVYRIISTGGDALHWPGEEMGNLRLAASAQRAGEGVPSPMGASRPPGLDLAPREREAGQALPRFLRCLLSGSAADSGAGTGSRRARRLSARKLRGRPALPMNPPASPAGRGPQRPWRREVRP